MAEVTGSVMKTINETNIVALIIQRTPAFPAGRLASIISMAVMALVPIVAGSFQSLHIENTLQRNILLLVKATNVMVLPVISSVALFILNCVAKGFLKGGHGNLITDVPFQIIGGAALGNLLKNKFSDVLPNEINESKLHLKLTIGSGTWKFHWINVKFTFSEVVSFIPCLLIATFYEHSKHWISNNLLTLAITTYAVQLIHIDTIKTGFILLFCHFVYDIFWVFCTDVMNTVYNSFNIPNKILLPHNLFENGTLCSTNFFVLRSIDIIIPGIFISFLLRFDRSLARETNKYFNTTVMAYFLGLVTGIIVGAILRISQPGLMYLIPFYLMTPILIAYISGDLEALLNYNDHSVESPNSSELSE